MPSLTFVQAYAVGNAIFARVRGLLKQFGFDDFRGTNVEVLGAEHTYGPHARSQDTREVVLRITAQHDQPRALGIFLMEIAPVCSWIHSLILFTHV
jgi:hypothetical protein